MAGGRFDTVNRIRPGFYANVDSDSLNVNFGGVRGVVTIPLSLGWGNVGKIVKVDATTNALSVLGYEWDSPMLLQIREALRHANSVLICRVNSGTAATATNEGLTITAVNGGSRGNDITVRVIADVNNASYFTVETLIDTTLIDSQTVNDVVDLSPNNFVSFSGTGLVASAGIPLTGGVDNEGTTELYTDYLLELEKYVFNVIALPTDNETLKLLTANYVRRQRDGEGKYCQLVVANFKADNEGIINVKDYANAVSWVAGVTAGANVNEGNTHRRYDGELSLTNLYSNAEIEDGLRSGEFILRPDKENILVEQDINSLTTFTKQRNTFFRKNRVLRVLDTLINDLKDLASNFFIGSITNNLAGRTLFRTEVLNYMAGLEALGAIENLETSDVEVIAGTEKDEVYVNIYIQPTDAIEKFFTAVKAR